MSALSASAQSPLVSDLPIVMDADHSEYNLDTNNMVFFGLRITQGATRVQAERAETAAGTNFADSDWQFSGDVEIDVGTARIRASTATLKFLNYQLTRANVAGSPATFSDTNKITGATTKGAADRFDYDLASEVVRFEDNASIANADNQVTGKLLLYNLAAQQVVFEGDRKTGERVRITIQPPPASDNASSEQTDALLDRLGEEQREPPR